MSMEKSTKIDNDICETHVQSLSSHWWLDICGIELDPLFLCKHLSVDLSYISMCTLNMEWIRKVAFTLGQNTPRKMVGFLLKKHFFIYQIAKFTAYYAA